MASPAADLQKMHALEGAPDPFPSLSDSTPAKARGNGLGKGDIDTESHSAFPSLASPTPTPVASTKSVWGSPSAPRIKSVVSRQPVASDSFDLQVDLSNAVKDGKPSTLGEIMKQVMAKYKVKLEASANQKTRQTTFHIKADSQKEIDKAKRTLLALLSPVVSLVVHAPASTIAAIIGPKGVTLKQIREQTNVRVDIPRRDTLAPLNGDAPAGSGKTTPIPGDEEEEATVPITITGPQPSAMEAKALLNQIIGTKTSKITQRIKNIPAHILPFIAGRRAEFQAVAEGAEINLALNTPECEVAVNGDRSVVPRVVEVINSTIEGLKTNLHSLKIPLPKRQHRLLAGKAVSEIMAKSRCSVVVADYNDPNEDVVIWGQATDLPVGLGAALEVANSRHIHEFPVPGPPAQSRQILAYLARIGYANSLHHAHPGVSVYIPPPAAANKGHALNIDVIGEKVAVDAAVQQLSEFVGNLVGATHDVPVDWLIHHFVASKNAKKLKQFNDSHHVHVYFPHESEEQSSILLVYDRVSSSTVNEKKHHLEEVAKEILKMAKDAGEVKSETISVDKKWHDAIVGRGGTTLNAIIGEDRALSIKVGASAGDPLSEHVILVRGASSQVDRAIKDILQIIENANNDEIDNNYSTEFDIDREFVGRVVGSQGSGINKLRDHLGVRVDVSDETDEKDKEVGKKKKGVHQKSKIKITGRKENVYEAKKRILSQLEKLADETSEVLKIPNQYHSSLIGQNGRYAIRLEEKYSVKITFPRQSPENGEGRTREQLKPDEVLIKGGKKGVAGAKSELLDAVEFEKESNSVLKFVVPTRSVARILGKGGASINEIKDNTDTQIDIDKSADDSGTTHITIRGTKPAIAAAKAAILAISDLVGEETTVTVTVESRFHRTLIGGGGQGLKDLVARCGGPSDTKLQAGLIRFPRQGEPSDEVRLRGEPKLVGLLKVELEKAVAALRDRIVLAVEMPAAQHRAAIGRGGQHLNDMQNRLGVQIQFPGSRSYHQVGEPENGEDIKDVDPANLVKISGPRLACKAAIDELKGQVREPAAEPVTATVSVPLKYHHAISQQGNFFRNLRSIGVQVDQSVYAQKSALPERPPVESAAPSARIDDPEPDMTSSGIEWQVVPNYQGAEEGDSEWTLKARDQAALESAQKLINEAIEHAQKMSHVAFLTLPDRSVFPRIVGTKGVNVARLRAETGADINVGKENNTIVIMGTESTIVSAKEAIMKIVSNSGRPQRPRQY